MQQIKSVQSRASLVEEGLLLQPPSAPGHGDLCEEVPLETGVHANLAPFQPPQPAPATGLTEALLCSVEVTL